MSHSQTAHSKNLTAPVFKTTLQLRSPNHRFWNRPTNQRTGTSDLSTQVPTLQRPSHKIKKKKSPPNQSKPPHKNRQNRPPKTGGLHSGSIDLQLTAQTGSIYRYCAAPLANVAPIVAAALRPRRRSRKSGADRTKISKRIKNAALSARRTSGLSYLILRPLAAKQITSNPRHIGNTPRKLSGY